MKNNKSLSYKDTGSDWEKEWESRVKLSSSRKGWDLFSSSDFAGWYDMQLRYNGYPGILLDKVLDRLGSGSTFLDIGAGTGAFSIPVSKKVLKVTAIEPSKGMRSNLRENIDGHGNIDIIDKYWEDIDEDEIEKHEMVLAANSLYRISSIVPALKKMLAMTDKCLCIIMTCRSSIYSQLWHRFKGEDYRPPPSFVHLYNILYSLGIIADIEIINKNHCYIYKDIEQAIYYWSVRLGIDKESTGLLKRYIEKLLKENETGLYHEEEGYDAIIWYEKDDRIYI